MFNPVEYWREHTKKRKEKQVVKPIADLSVFCNSMLPREGQVNHAASREQKRQHKARRIQRRRP